MNILESALNVAYVYFAWVSTHLSRVPRAQVAGLVGASLTCAKTILYLLNDAYCGPNGWCHTGQNDGRTWFLLWFLPNTPWMIVPGVIALILGRDILQQLQPDSSSSRSRPGQSKRARADKAQ